MRKPIVDEWCIRCEKKLGLLKTGELRFPFCENVECLRYGLLTYKTLFGAKAPVDTQPSSGEGAV